MHMNSLVDDPEIPKGPGDDAFQFSDFDGINDEDFNHNFYGFSGGSNNLSPIRKGPQPITKGLGSFDPIPMQKQDNGFSGSRKFGLGSSNFDAIPMNSNDDIFDNTPIQKNAGFNSFHMENNQQNNNNFNGFDAIPMGDSSRNSRIFGDLPQQQSQNTGQGKKSLFDPIPFANQQSNFDSIPFKETKNSLIEQRMPISQSNASLQSNASGSKRLLGGGLLRSLTQSSNAFTPNATPKANDSTPHFQTIDEKEEDDIFADAPALNDTPNMPRTSSNAMDFKHVSSTGIPFSSSIDSLRAQGNNNTNDANNTTQPNIVRPVVEKTPTPQIQIRLPDNQNTPVTRSPPKSQSVPFNMLQQDFDDTSQQIRQPGIRNTNQFMSEDNIFQTEQQNAAPNFPSPSQFKQQQNQTTSEEADNFSYQQPKPNFSTPQQQPQDFQTPISPQPQNTTQIQKNIKLPIEIGFSASLDRSLANFRRNFTSEFASLLRQNNAQNTTLLEVDDFLDQLNNDVVSLIETPVNQADINSQSISRKISLAIDEHTKPVSAALAEADARNSVAEEHHISELKQLQDEIDSLRHLFKTCSDNLIRELDRERQTSSQERDVELSKQREIDQKMRTLKLRKIELETKAKNQQIEKDSLERSLKSFEHKRKDWEENVLPKMLDERGAIKSRILQELNSLKNEITQESFDELTTTINEAINIIREEGDNLRNDLLDLEMSSRWLASKPKAQVPRPKSPRKLKKSSILDQTQEKLNRIRKQREESIKSLTNQL